MKIIPDKKFSPKKRNRPTPPKPSIRLRRNDWGALMQHDRLTGKLNLKSKEVIRDPGSVKRLLEAAMIYADGKLTPEARKRCALLAEKLQKHRTLSSADPKLPGDHKPAALPGRKTGKVDARHWAVLMRYDRKTGNLLRIDPKTGRLDKSSRLMLKNPSIIQHLIDKNLILPGGWLTPEAKQGCVRIEKKIKAQAQDHCAARGDHSRRKSKNEPNSKIQSGCKSKADRNSQYFFESLPSEAMVAPPESGSYGAYDWQNEKDLQAFFESLPVDGPGPDPELFFVYDWQDEHDLQAYFEKLPLDSLNPGIIKRSARQSAPRAARGAGDNRRDAGSRNRQQQKKEVRKKVVSNQAAKSEAGQRKIGTQIFTQVHR